MKWAQLYYSLNILWHCLSLGQEGKLTFSSPMATTEFSKSADILSATTASSFRILNNATGNLLPPRWNWKLILLKLFKMLLTRPWLTNLTMTVRADCTVFVHNPLPQPVKSLAHWWSVARIGLWTGICPPSTQCPASKIKQIFHQCCLLIGFWTTRIQIPLLVTISQLNFYFACVFISWISLRK